MESDEKKRPPLKYDTQHGFTQIIQKVCGTTESVVHEQWQEVINERNKETGEIITTWAMPEAQICSFCHQHVDHVLCCDTCMTSFHLYCLGIRQADVPPAEFICNRCKKRKEDQPKFEPNNTNIIPCPKQRKRDEYDRYYKTVSMNLDDIEDVDIPKESWVPRIRIRKEDGEIDEIAENEDRELGYSEENTIHKFWPDTKLINALIATNPMEYTLPEYIEAEIPKVDLPWDVLKDTKMPIYNKNCAKCKKENRHSVMLRCQFCTPNTFWHMNCLDTPVYRLPNRRWMCPLHVEHVVDTVQGGQIIVPSTRINKYEEVSEYTDTDDHEINAMMEKLTFLANQNRQGNVENSATKWKNEKTMMTKNDWPSFQEVIRREGKKPGPSYISTIFHELKPLNRKITRGRKKDGMSFNIRLFYNVYALETPSTSRNSVEKEVRKERFDEELDRLDEQRSIPFSEDDLIESIGICGSNLDNQRTFNKFSVEIAADMRKKMVNYNAVVRLNRMMMDYSDEQDILYSQRHGLNMKETIRGVSMESIRPDYDPKESNRWNVEKDGFLSVFGIGKSVDVRASSRMTDAFFRRCAPPLLPQEMDTPESLRHSILNSAKCSIEGFNQFVIYRNLPKQLENHCIFMYEPHFETKIQRDTCYSTSMTPFSKEFVLDIVENRWEIWGKEMEQWTPPDGYVKEEEKDVKEQIATTSGVLIPSNETPKKEEITESTRQSMESCSIQGNDIYANRNGHHRSKIDHSAKLASVLAPRKRRHHDDGEMVQSPTNGRLTPPSPPPIPPPKAPKWLDTIDETITEVVKQAKKEYDVYTNQLAKHPSLRDHDYVKHPYYDYEINSEIRSLINQFKNKPDLDSGPSVGEMLRNNSSGAMVGAQQTQMVGVVDEFPSQQFARQKPSTTPLRGSESQLGRRRGRPRGSKNRSFDDSGPLETDERGTTRPTRGRGSRGGRIATGVRSADRISQPFHRYDNAPAEPAKMSFEQKMRLKNEVASIREKFGRLHLRRMVEVERNTYFQARDFAIREFTTKQWHEMAENVYDERMNRSTNPFEPRFFLPNSPVFGYLEIVENEGRKRHLPIAIQRGLTKIGTARDCHLQADRKCRDYCRGIGEYHCDIIYDNITNRCILSTLSKNGVIVNDCVVRRKKLAECEKLELKKIPDRRDESSKLWCKCEKSINDRMKDEKSRNSTGLVDLQHNTRIKIGCLELVFSYFPRIVR